MIYIGVRKWKRHGSTLSNILPLRLLLISSLSALFFLEKSKKCSNILPYVFNSSIKNRTYKSATQQKHNSSNKAWYIKRNIIEPGGITSGIIVASQFVHLLYLLSSFSALMLYFWRIIQLQIVHATYTSASVVRTSCRL